MLPKQAADPFDTLGADLPFRLWCLLHDRRWRLRPIAVAKKDVRGQVRKIKLAAHENARLRTWYGVACLQLIV
jgi:hypothetical protein